jgi:alpha-soluble NSF attachment protein
LQKALALFVKRNDLQMAAVTCEELAELYMEQQELQNAVDFFEQATVHYGTDRRSQQSKFEADRLRFVLANKERYRQSSDPNWHSQLYEVFASGIM